MKTKDRALYTRNSKASKLVCIFRRQAWQQSLKIMVVILCVLMTSLISLTACQPENEYDFPQVPSYLDGSEQTNQADNNTPDINDGEQPADPYLPELKEPIQLTAALPFGEDALEMLRLYFLASQSDTFSASDAITANRQETLDHLRLFDAPLSINLELVSLEQGINGEQAARWAATNDMPDLFYGMSSFHTLSEHTFLDMSPYLADASFINPEYLYASLLKAGRSHNKQIALPYLASTPILYVQQDFCDSQRVRLPDQDWTWQSFARLLDILQQHLIYLDQDVSLYTSSQMTHNQNVTTSLSAGRRVVLANPLSMADWLPAQMDPDLQWLGYQSDNDFSAGQFIFAAGSINIYRQRNQASANALEILETLTLAGLSPLHLSEEMKDVAGFTQAFIQNNQALLWFDDSSRLPYWMQLKQFQVTPLLLPGKPDTPVSASDKTEMFAPERPVYADDDWLPYLYTLINQIDQPRLPVQLRMLAVSANSDYPEIASKLAATIALDSQSLLLQSRYQLYEGYMPVVQDEAVWDDLVSRQVYGYRLRSLAPRLSSAVVIGSLGTDRQSLMRQINSDWSQALYETVNQLPLRHGEDTEPEEEIESEEET